VTQWEGFRFATYQTPLPLLTWHWPWCLHGCFSHLISLFSHSCCTVFFTTLYNISSQSVLSRSTGIREGELFNSLHRAKSHNNDQETGLKTKLYLEWQWNCKRQLWNFVTLLLMQWVWKWIVNWKKFSTTQCLISQNHRMQEIDKFTPTLPLCAEKARDSVERKRRKKRKGITTLGSSSCLCWWSRSSSGGHAPGGQGLLVVGAQCKVLVPSPFIPFGCLSHSFPKVLKNESVGVEGLSWWSHSVPPPFPPPESKC